MMIAVTGYAETTVCKSVTLTYNKKESFWKKNSAPLITGGMTLLGFIVTLIVARKTIQSSTQNLNTQLKLQSDSFERQMKMQVSTTIEKEWIQSVRIAIHSFLEALLPIYNFYSENAEYQRNNADLIFALRLTLESKKDMCEILLNPNETYQKALLDVLKDFYNKVTQAKGEVVQAETLRKGLLNAVHNLVEFRQPQF